MFLKIGESILKQMYVASDEYRRYSHLGYRIIVKQWNNNVSHNRQITGPFRTMKNNEHRRMRQSIFANFYEFVIIL